MFASGTKRYAGRRRVSPGGCVVARETRTGYAAQRPEPTAGPPTLAEALAGLQAAVDALAAVNLEGEDDRAVLDAVVAQERLAARLAAAQLRAVGSADRREAYCADAAVTMASWYRARTRLDHGEAARRVHAAARLRRLPALAAALDAGEVTLAHVTTVTAAAVPLRMAAIAAAEDTLVTLARRAGPREVKIALRRIADCVDPDGAEVPPLAGDGPDERRHLDVWPGIDGLGQVRGCLEQVDTEALMTVLDALDTPDPPNTPVTQRRSAGQRRADALGRLARLALDAGLTPTVQGAKPHVLVMVDVATLVGADDAAARPPRLRWTGPLPPDRARRIAEDAKITAVQTLGPWRVVNVGRTARTLPAWLRPALEMIHRHCRGPDCDRPAVWTEAHHQTPWDAGADTDLNATIPLCKAHHDLVTTGAWNVAFDPDTGRCTWTARHHNRVLVTHPPPP